MSLDPSKEILSLSFDHDGAHMAMCHKLQGYGANGRPEALIIKSDAKITDEVLADAEFIKSGIKPDEKDSLSEGNSEVKTDDITKSGDDSIQPSENKPKENQGDLMADNQEKLDKAQEAIDAKFAEMESKLEAFEKAAEKDKLEKAALEAKVEAFEKAKEAERFALFEKCVESYSFITPEDKEEFTKALIELDSEIVVDALDKAQKALDAIDKTQGHDGHDDVEFVKSSSLEEKLKAKYGAK